MTTSDWLQIMPWVLGAIGSVIAAALWSLVANVTELNENTAVIVVKVESHQ